MTNSEPEASEAESAEDRRRRAARVLGRLLPDQTSDETVEGWGDDGSDSRDEEIRRDVPPHHGT